MGQEEFVEGSYKGALGDPEREYGRALLVARAAAGESRASGAPGVEDRQRAAATTRAVRQEPAWQAVARATGRPGYFLAKRCLDVTLAGGALLLLLPLLGLLAALVRLTSRGPALFAQERVGFGGRPFTMYKFRSMYLDSDERVHRAAYEQFLRGERKDGKVDGTLLAGTTRGSASRDPRVTPLGDLLRRSSLDEVPQLVNVLRGEMSLVGPRPPIPYEVSLYQPRHRGRLETLPGLTGSWQVHGRSRVSFEQMVQMDLDYIARQAFWYDVQLLLLTIPAVLSRKGAY